MVFSTLMYASKKDGVSYGEFKSHYEDIHIPLVKSIAGDLFPTGHIRRYVGRTADKPTGATSQETPQGADERCAAALGLLNGSQPPGAPLIIMGKPEDFDFDVLAEINFADEEHFKKFMGVFMDEANAKRLAEDEETFIDRASLRGVILGDVRETRNENYKATGAPQIEETGQLAS